jgi:cysteinyl-tRNA synthetase
MGLKLHNTLTRTKEEFRPIDPLNVRMYACGPTVYDFVHIGNGRMAIVFDVLFRLLRHTYGADHVTYVRNITDVDDKINARAAEAKIDIRELTETTARQYKEDVAGLGCLTPTYEPRATENIPEMKALIERLVARRYAYVAADHVLFHVAAMKDYGKLSNRSLEDMLAGARVEVAPYKRDPMDFVLWKPSKPGEPSWPSPAGIAAPGRPGWHIECSAMAARLLGETFDIHGGGIDLVFPHHENEIAQSCCAFGTKRMANYWLHNGFLQVEGEKMSKSLGNFVTIRDMLKEWPGEVVRLNMLKTHYRQPIDWTESGLHESARTLDQWYEAIGDVAPGMLCADVVDALSDDLNTPKAFAALYGLREEAAAGAMGAKASLKATAGLLGLLNHTASEWKRARTAAAGVDERHVADLVAARAAARKAKDFAAADRIRGELDALGIALKDAKDPQTGELTTTWEVKR